MSSNPQPSAVDLDSLWREDLPAMPRAVADVLDDWITRRFGKESSHHGAGLFLNLLAEEGYEVTPQASSAERDKEELVERIAAELADYCLNIGPNTRDLIASGSWKRMPLSVSERRDIAELAATEALKPQEEL